MNDRCYGCRTLSVGGPAFRPLPELATTRMLLFLVAAAGIRRAGTIGHLGATDEVILLLPVGLICWCCGVSHDSVSEYIFH